MKLAVCLGILISCSAAAAFQAAPGGLRLLRAHHRVGSRAEGVCGLRAQQQPTLAMPDLSTIGRAAQELGQSLQYAAAQPLRARYCAAQVARFAFFLTQSTAVTVWGASEDANNRRLPIEISTIVGALTDAILKEDKTDFDLNVPLKDKPSLIPDEQRQLFNKNFQAIIDLIKTDLRNIEDGKYALPYDLEPSYAPQWSPLPVIGKINQFLSERDEVMARVVNRKGMEIREDFKAEKSRYPRYYLQNFHYQSNGWLSDKSARVYDYQVTSFPPPCSNNQHKLLLHPRYLKPHIYIYAQTNKALKPQSKQNSRPQGNLILY
jgi:hypothetical protein